MKTTTLAIGLAGVSATLLMFSQSAHAVNLALNGGFDNFELKEGQRGTQTNWNYFDGEYLDVNQSVLGWQVTDGGTLEVRKNGVVGLADGGTGYFAELDAHNYKSNVASDEDLGIFQDIATQIGKTYQFSFSYAARPGIDGNRNQFEALFGNTFEQQFDGGNGKVSEGKEWKTFSTRVVATSETTRMQFNYLGHRDTLGAHIDSVSVEAVPEPGALAGLAFMGMIALGSKVKQRQATLEG